MTVVPGPKPTSTVDAVVTPTPELPTPIAQTCPTPGTYTFPATTIVVTETTTVCAASTTEVPAGTHTLGGVTTVVTTATTVVCPVATTETQDGTVTSVIKTTTFVCPEPGTYTIGPITTEVPDVTTVVVPVVTTICPGTYTAPEITTTITATNTVIYCPFTSVGAPEPTSEPTSAPQEAPKAPEEPAAPAAPAPAPSSKTVPTGKGKHWAMTYTPYTEDGNCKAASEVDSDVAAIASAGFSTLRVYSTDCNTLENVGAACRKHGLRLIVGVFIGAHGCSNGSPSVDDQLSALKKWDGWDLVDLCVVGNEALFNGFCTVSQLTSLIERTKSELASVYTGPFTTTDVVSAWQNNDVTQLCAAIDVVACNAHAYFNPDTKPKHAGKFVKGQLAIVEGICNKSGLILETGWPNAGKCYGVACAGPQEQAEAIHSIEDEVGDKAVFFSFRNDKWKAPGDCNCERNWGCAEVFGL
jgi:exo-beta-1,3-glucanase (GH17 family)